MKKNVCRDLSKMSLLALCFVLSFGLLSCEKEELFEIEEELSQVEEVSIVDDGYSYVYNGDTYNYSDFNKIGVETKYMIGIDDVIYVFDTEDKALGFEKGDFQNIVKASVEKVEADHPSSNTKAPGDIAWGTAIYELTFYNYKHFDVAGGWAKYTVTHPIGHKQTWIGYEWVDQKYETDLPAEYRNITSSWKMKYVQIPIIDGYDMVLEVKLRSGLLSSDRNVNWSKKLRRYDDYKSDGDLSDNRIASTLWIAHWNNQIEAFKIEFNSY